MKIEHKIYISHLIHIGLIILIGSFAMHDLDQLLTKFRFVEIADDLNMSFLEMRLAEKNYVIYGDDDALQDIRNKIAATTRTLLQVQQDIIQAVGSERFTQLEQYMYAYAALVKKIHRQQPRDPVLLKQLRAAGHKLELFLSNVTVAERQRVASIVSQSKKILHYLFWTVIGVALLSGRLIGRHITVSLRRIVDMTDAISKGNFQAIDRRPAKDEMGAVIEAISSMAEELEKREQELIQSRRLASIGIMVAGIAHELSNPLNNISMIAQTYADVYDQLSREERLEFMAQVEEQGERLRVIIKNLLNFSRPKEPQLAEAEINEIIRKAIELVHNMLEVSNIKLILQLGEDLPTVYVDEHQILQVLVNITTNAIQVMTDMNSGGELRIGSRYLADSDDVEIEISDTGKGIAPELLDHIFDPFFTTKGDSGTGLGLWVSYGIIKNHGGIIRVESTVGVGTEFFITLPSCKKSKRCTDVPVQHNGH
ncbi:MAG TPA: sensor histidine kinase [Desulfobulbus sp.]|nr:sensor histidine kinase [Desulfobulbus sp.]